MKKVSRSLVPAIAAVVFSISPAVMMPHTAVTFAQSAQDAQIKADILNNALNKSKFKNIQVSVQNGIVVLSGTVDVYDTKLDADRRVHRVKNVKGVENDIEVAGPEVPDQQLQDKLIKAIMYDRVGYPGDSMIIRDVTPFNAISVSVHNGVVTLGGHAYGPVDADSAVAVAANTPGVKDVINDIQVDPVSPMDDRIRIAVFRAIYGFPSLNKYAIDPAKPIRISVQNGHVTLYGVVDNQGDKEAAGIRANSVPGVFSVTNDLQVAGQPEKK
ncbi:BON domain-containing protein [Pseudacidobacterium ailaaui]|uniref:BON domain-containing protein n=1 Tax=Pseudacidobacterium ailaaui TaxID=1382359 RepID=UPI000679585C|nr:BON domain-containing protein [Pseudacidobacterium ailaaui]MBX6358589.1 BON domain-containing protein [Pseudacidobacterium ailaaui]MDI3254947.1 BON domain-containing protein [Bacillota bacterium]